MSDTNIKCRMCGADAFTAKGYLKRVNELGVQGVWQCAPSCDAELSEEDRVVLAIEGDAHE